MKNNTGLPGRILSIIGADYTKKQKFTSLLISLFFSLIVIAGISYNLLSSVESFEYNPLASVDNHIIDGFFIKRLKSGQALEQLRDEKSMSLAIVDIDDDSLDQMNLKWPIPRSIYGKIIEKLHKAGAKTIGFDIVMPDESIADEDFQLTQVLDKSNNVFMAEFFYQSGHDGDEGDPSGGGAIIVAKPYAPFTEALEKSGENRLGYVSIQAESVIRRLDLGRTINGKEHFLLSPLLCSHFLDIPQNQLKNQPALGFFQLGPVKIPTTQDQARINYFFPPGRYCQNFTVDCSISQVVNEFSMKNVLEDMTDEDLKLAFGGKLVLVGPTASGAGDIKTTPFGQIPGVFVHANLILSILSGRFLHAVSPISNIFIMLAVGILIGLVIPRLSPVAGAVFTAIFAMGYYNLSYQMFLKQGSIVFISAPLICAFLGYLSVNVYHHLAETRSKAGIQKMMKEFAPIPVELIQEYLEKYGGSAATGGELAHVTVLFADIRGYTQMSEGMSSQEVMMTLNEYHSAMGKIFEETGGVIFTYIGDAQLVVYGLEGLSKVNHAAASIKAGIMMQEKMRSIREKLEQMGKYPFEVGIGICTGSLSIGVVGSAQLKQYTVIGDTVNVASRIQGMSRELNAPVLIHERTYLMAKHCIEAEKLRPVKLKGKKEPVNVYRAKAVKEITPYSGDEIADLDREVEALRLDMQAQRAERLQKREEQQAKADSESGENTGENLPRGVKRRVRRSAVSNGEKTDSESRDEGDLLTPLEEGSKGSLYDGESEVENKTDGDESAE